MGELFKTFGLGGDQVFGRAKGTHLIQQILGLLHL